MRIKGVVDAFLSLLDVIAVMVVLIDAVDQDTV